MNYEQFVCAMIECTKKKLSGSEQVIPEKILKNNGITVTGVAIRRAEGKIALFLDLEESYRAYLAGEQVESLAECLVEKSRNVHEIPEWDFKEMQEFDKVRGRIVYKLVNAGKNESLLKKVPYLPIFDLAMIFYLMIPVSKSERGSVLIQNTHLKQWELPVSLLYETAKENTPGLLPPVLCSIMDFLEPGEEAPEYPILVLTNEAGINGASVLLYPGIPELIYERAGGGYYLLPASVHEFLIVPEKEGIDPDKLLCMVQEINATEIAEEEFLSDHIYYFNGNNITEI